MSNDIQKELVKAAMDMGAMDATVFRIEDVAFDSRTMLKCQFGCPGGMHYCPSGQDVSAVMAYQEMARKYKWGILICTDNLKSGQDITLALESKAFLAGYYFALGTTECVNCTTCTRESDGPCVDKRKQRPPLYTLGIDVYKTVRNVGWELEVVQKKGDPVKNITAVFVE